MTASSARWHRRIGPAAPQRCFAFSASSDAVDRSARSSNSSARRNRLSPPCRVTVEKFEHGGRVAAMPARPSTLVGLDPQRLLEADRAHQSWSRRRRPVEARLAAHDEVVASEALGRSRWLRFASMSTTCKPIARDTPRHLVLHLPNAGGPPPGFSPPPPPPPTPPCIEALGPDWLPSTVSTSCVFTRARSPSRRMLPPSE